MNPVLHGERNSLRSSLGLPDGPGLPITRTEKRVWLLVVYTQGRGRLAGRILPKCVSHCHTKHGNHLREREGTFALTYSAQEGER